MAREPTESTKGIVGDEIHETCERIDGFPSFRPSDPGLEPGEHEPESRNRVDRYRAADGFSWIPDKRYALPGMTEGGAARAFGMTER